MTRRRIYTPEQEQLRKERHVRSVERRESNAAAQKRRRLAELIAEGQALAGKGERMPPVIVEVGPMASDVSRCFAASSSLV